MASLAVSPRPVRSATDALAPLHRLARNSPFLAAKTAGRFECEGKSYELPRFLFTGPQGGDDPIRLGIFAALHGDHPASTHGLVQFLSLAHQIPELATGYSLFAYPICNPTGFEDGTRHSRRGRDLNREFWNHTKEPEVLLLQEEISLHAFHGLISLHTDEASAGLYGFVRGATLTKHLLEPALAAAEQMLPRNPETWIDGFKARKGIIREGYQGVLSAPPGMRPRPFEISFQMPGQAPQYLQEKAFVVVLQTLLDEYRKLLAYAPNL